MSGYVTCHGFDQAALQTLMLLRQFPHIPYHVNPFGFSTLHTLFNGTGCNPTKNDFSADYKFDRILMNLGFIGAYEDFFNHTYSSYTMGCVNDLINDFHVITETSELPRLHCFHCSRSWEIMTPATDGHVGGGNERIRIGSINSWFTNHKVGFLFHEQYLNVNSCKELNFLPPCISSSINSRTFDYNDEVAINSNDYEDDYDQYYIDRSYIDLLLNDSFVSGISYGNKFSNVIYTFSS